MIEGDWDSVPGKTLDLLFFPLAGPLDVRKGDPYNIIQDAAKRTRRFRHVSTKQRSLQFLFHCDEGQLSTVQ